ncbi:MAG: amino acid adenylation domain-containing protein, partial [Bacteroidales bacterium]|nr:amino acid adenylation domain-containing protein [Bacteroidales bacterium]
AAKILSFGLKDEDVVAVLIGRNAWMTKASLAALKTGCAYQPLDPSYPPERLNFMIRDSHAKLLIADKELVPLVGEYKGPVLTTDQLDNLPEGKPTAGPKPESLFILLYTSGSTGTPKGCMLEQRNLVNFCAWYRDYYQLKPGDRVAAFASYGFDANMMDQYPALTSGACVCIIPEDVRHDLGALNSFLIDNGVTHSFMTTQVGVMYARNFPDNPVLKHLSVGGEKLISMPPPSYAFYNGYGPTECTIFSSVFRVLEREDNIPIGHPLSNVQLYVSDQKMRRLPIGAAGELFIGGHGVGRGYLNNPEKTAESFIENPYQPGVRLYRSGDIVRFRPDGNVEFVGRKDRQVKIRGFRIELKEVEGVLQEFPGVKDVTVQAFDAPSGGKFLAAYVVADGTFDSKAAADFIRERKPPYMVPAAWMQLDAIPLNVNQKVDRKALPEATPSSVDEYVAPAGETEKALCDIFAEILGVEKVGATDSFFDLGGSSLMVTNVMVNAEKKGLHFAYSDVFSHPSARSLAAFLKGDEGTHEQDSNITDYDYSAIDTLLAQNNLESFLKGKRMRLGKNILLTGATGFLGIHVLKELLETTGPDTTVWCLLREKGALTPERRLKEMLVYYFDKDYRSLVGTRIKPVAGDITLPETLAPLTDIDMVFNCAANVKHFSKGTDIEDINYGGVKNLVDLCEKNGAYLVHVST